MKKDRGIYERLPGCGVWWIRYHDGEGRRHREKAGSKSAALTLYQKRKVQALEGRKLPELHRRRVSFGQVAAAASAYCQERHRNKRNTPPLMRRFLGWWKDRPAESLSPAEIEERLSSVGWSTASFNRARALLSLTYNLAIRAGKVSVNPARVVAARPERNVRQGFLDSGQYYQLAAACDSLWLRAFIALGFTYGWRSGELIGLRVSQVNLPERTVRLEPGTTKNTEGRTIGLTTETLELLRACCEGKSTEDAVFTDETGQPVRAYRWAWEKLCVKAGLGRFLCRGCGTAARPCLACAKAGKLVGYGYEGPLVHDLRRSAVRNLERAGVPRSVAMRLSGHKTESVYRRYAIVSPSDLAEATQRLEKLRNEQPPEQPPRSKHHEIVSTKVV